MQFKLSKYKCYKLYKLNYDYYYYVDLFSMKIGNMRQV